MVLICLLFPLLKPLKTEQHFWLKVYYSECPKTCILNWTRLKFIGLHKCKVYSLHLRSPESQLLNKPKVITTSCLISAVRIILCIPGLVGHVSPVSSSSSCGFCSLGCYATEGPTASHTIWDWGTGEASGEAQTLFPTVIRIRWWLGLCWVQAPLPASLDAGSR